MLSPARPTSLMQATVLPAATSAVVLRSFFGLSQDSLSMLVTVLVKPIVAVSYGGP